MRFILFFFNSSIYSKYSFGIDLPDRSSLRIAYFSILLLVTVLWAVYSATVIFILTSDIHVLLFDSLESFILDDNYQLTVMRDTAGYDKFPVSII